MNPSDKEPKISLKLGWCAIFDYVLIYGPLVIFDHIYMKINKIIVHWQLIIFIQDYVQGYINFLDVLPCALIVHHRNTVHFPILIEIHYKHSTHGQFDCKDS